jgi:hypothetical protein
MSTHIGTLETAVEIDPGEGPGIEVRERDSSLDERSRFLQRLAREREIARRTLAEGLSDG